MKLTRFAVYAFVLPVVVFGSFFFGRYVSLSANMPLREAHELAANHANRGLWQLEAQNETGPHDLAVPVSYPASQVVAQNDTGAQNPGGGENLFSSTSPLVTFQQVYELLKENYVDRIDSDTPLAHGAVSALIASLDEPNSRFLEPDERTALDNQSKGVYSGSGIVFTVRKATVAGLLERQLTVIDAVAGSPAQKAGIQTGDVVTNINGHWVISYDPFAAQIKLFKSLENDPVSFNHEVDATDAKIKSGLDLAKAQALLNATSTAPLQLSITRGSINLSVNIDVSAPTSVEDVTSKVLPDGNGYVQFNAFTDTTASDFEKAFQQVSSTPGTVIDLRNCPGGSLDPVLSIAQALDSNAPLGSIAVRNNQGSYDSSAGFKVKTIPLTGENGTAPQVSPISYSGHFVVLVNQGTANVAELFASFLHDSLGARIVGDKTFGDGMVQTLFPEEDGSAFTLTTGIVKTGQNYEFEAKGLVPDIALAKDQVDTSAALGQAETLLSLKPLNVSNAVAASGQQKS